MDAQKRRLYAAMMQSLASSFAMTAEGRNFVTSFHPADIAEMLRDCAEEIAPKPASVRRDA